MDRLPVVTDQLPTEKTPTEKMPSDDGEAPPSGRCEQFFRFVPALGSLRHYSLLSFRLDLIAGLTVAAVAVPQAMAYATIAGIPPEYGLYTAIIMTAIGALFDSSKQLINGPTNAISIAMLSALAALPLENNGDRISAAILLAFLVGFIQTGITLLRLGDLTRYISHAVIVGFTLGASILLVLDQMKNFLGLRAAGDPHDHFLKRFWLTVQNGRINGWTLLVGIGTVAIILALRRLQTRFRIRLPEFLCALLVMSVVVWLGGLSEEKEVAVVGRIPSALPSPAVPRMDWEWLRTLSPSALAIALLGLLEAVAMAKAIAAQTGQKLDINQQCLSEGLANLGGSFFQCFPGSGSLTRSAINQQAGAATQWSGVFSAVVVAAMVLLFEPFAEHVAPLPHYIPRASLAGILLVSSWRLVDRKQLMYHLKATRFDAGIVIATALAAVAVSIEFCILIGVFLSFLLYVPRAAKVILTELTLTPERVIRERLDNDVPCERMLIFNLEGELFFGSAPELDAHISTIERRIQPGTRVLVLRMKRARNPDAVCLERIEVFIKRMQARNVEVLLCGVRRDLAKVLRSSGIEDLLGSVRVFRETPGVGSSTLDAVRYAYELLRGDLCASCPRRNDNFTGKESWYYMI